MQGGTAVIAYWPWSVLELTTSPIARDYASHDAMEWKPLRRPC